MSVAEFLGQMHDTSMGSDYDTLNHAKDDNEPGALLAHVTEQKKFTPGELQRLMSDKLAATPARTREQKAQKAAQHEITIDGKKYRECNVTSITYSVLQVSTRKHLALVDRGANGGIAGDDVRIITKANRCVDVQGIDNHQVTNIPIVTCAGVIHTQRGPAIAIMNQFALIGKGQSILSSAQLEHFGINVDDKSSKVGGQQRISTPDGFVIPVDIKNGLPYVRMRPPTDRELSNPDIPHVVLTSDVDWDPSAVDSSIDDLEAWAQSIPDDGSEEGERPFDRAGMLKSNKTVTSLKESTLEDAIDFFVSCNCVVPTDGLYESYSRNIPGGLDWFECNMVDLLYEFDQDFTTPIIPPEFEVYQTNLPPPSISSPHL